MSTGSSPASSNRSASPSLVLHVVPHTHWDREWYEPFEVYRFQLVKAVDRLLEVFRTDPGFRHFNFDGQTAAIEDYLAVRPEAEAAVARAVAEGRLAVGPWRILMDEFLCSPETIVRNLAQGTATAARLGGFMRVGYIPDSFGHVAQMPQILRLAGFDRACVWRGVPRAVDRTVFRWEAPDGSWVRSAYLATSYSNGASLPETVEDLLVRARRIVEDLAPFGPDGIVLAMNGSDHRAPEGHLPTLFAVANQRQDEVEFRLGSMEEYLAAAPDGDGLPVWRGEMRSGARANLLMGVASARVPLKQAEFAASTTLERYAEPLSALAGTDPGTLLDGAWRDMVENSAHDSICGCGIDEVARHVATRYRRAERVADLVATDALQTLAGRVDTEFLATGAEGIVVFNPSPRARAGVVELTLMAPGPPEALAFRSLDGPAHPAQVLEVQEQVVVDMTLRGSQLARIVPTIHSRMLGTLYVNDVAIEPGRLTTVRLRLGPAPEGRFDVEAAKRAVETAIDRDPRGRFRVVGNGPPLCRVLARAPSIEGLGWTTLEPVTAGADLMTAGSLAERREGDPGAASGKPDDMRSGGAREVGEPSNGDAARAEGHLLGNGTLEAAIGPDGRVALLHVPSGARYENLFGIEDGGDGGDEYNYSPPDKDLVVIEPVEPAVVEEIERGPLQATLRVTTRYRVPAALAAKGNARARRAVVLPVVTDYSLRAGEPFLRATIRVRNEARDHRLRALFPLPFAAPSSHADGAFHVTERGLIAEGGDHETGLPTFPCRRWVDASDEATGLAVLHRGTPEYELAADGRALAVTLLRSVGWLSRQGMRYRAGPAGPALQTPGAQLPGDHRFDLAVYPHAGDWRTGNVHQIAEAFTYPFRAAGARAHPGPLPPSGTALSIEPDCVQLSALTRESDAVLCRLYNASDDSVYARIHLGPILPHAHTSRVGLLGDHLEDLPLANGRLDLPLRPWEITTLRLSSA